MEQSSNEGAKVKFAIGDKVIVIRASYGNKSEIGWMGIVGCLHDAGNYCEIDVEVDHSEATATNYGYKFSDLELISVYNSPLYNSLK